ncbi:MAG: methyltransferase domain-containing protein [Pseudomonadota bacterium]
MFDDENQAILERLALAYDRAQALDDAGETEAAVAAWREVLEIDPVDHAGARLRLALAEGGAHPEAAAPAYVRTLFDQFAENFEETLVEHLAYRVPETLAERLRLMPGLERPETLDLGCGTGLAAAALDGWTGAVTGVDLSEEMLARADAREIYAELYVAEAVGFLETAAWPDQDGERLGPWDLILATDVMPYLGAMERFAAAAAASLRPRGRLAFSTETLPEAAFEGRGWRIGPHQRYHHAPDYVREAMEGAGLSVDWTESLTIRLNEGVPEPGHIYITRKP